MRFETRGGNMKVMGYAEFDVPKSAENAMSLVKVRCPSTRAPLPLTALLWDNLYSIGCQRAQACRRQAWGMQPHKEEGRGRRGRQVATLAESAMCAMLARHGASASPTLKHMAAWAVLPAPLQVSSLGFRFWGAKPLW